MLATYVGKNMKIQLNEGVSCYAKKYYGKCKIFNVFYNNNIVNQLDTVNNGAYVD